MSLQEINIDLEYESNLQNNILLTLDSVPYATAIYISKFKTIHLNKFAAELLEIQEKEIDNLKKWDRTNPHLKVLFKNINKNTLFNQKTLLHLPRGRKEIIDFNISTLQNTSIGDIHIIYFKKASTKYSISSISSLFMIKEEMKKLKPYLNKTGKSLHEEILTKFFEDENKSTGIEDFMYFQKEMTVIQTAFPFLSLQEVIICSLLANHMDNEEISMLTKKSLNSIFVMIHRINKKLKVRDRVDLLALLFKIIKDEEEGNSNAHLHLPVVEDFDL